jgi:hypothetical protein
LFTGARLLGSDLGHVTYSLIYLLHDATHISTVSESLHAFKVFRRKILGFKAENVDLGGLVVSVLATGPKVRGFDPDRVRWIF